MFECIFKNMKLLFETLVVVIVFYIPLSHAVYEPYLRVLHLPQAKEEEDVASDQVRLLINFNKSVRYQRNDSYEVEGAMELDADDMGMQLGKEVRLSIPDNDKFSFLDFLCVGGYSESKKIAKSYKLDGNYSDQNPYKFEDVYNILVVKGVKIYSVGILPDNILMGVNGFSQLLAMWISDAGIRKLESCCFMGGFCQGMLDVLLENEAVLLNLEDYVKALSDRSISQISDSELYGNKRLMLAQGCFEWLRVNNSFERMKPDDWINIVRALEQIPLLSSENNFVEWADFFSKTVPRLVDNSHRLKAVANCKDFYSDEDFLNSDEEDMDVQAEGGAESDCLCLKWLPVYHSEADQCESAFNAEGKFRDLCSQRVEKIKNLKVQDKTKLAKLPNVLITDLKYIPHVYLGGDDVHSEADTFIVTVPDKPEDLFVLKCHFLPEKSAPALEIEDYEDGPTKMIATQEMPPIFAKIIKHGYVQRLDGWRYIQLQEFIPLSFKEGYWRDEESSKIDTKYCTFIKERFGEFYTFIHGGRIAYRDLKIGNVGVDSKGNPRIFDFGALSKIYEIEDEDEDGDREPFEPLQKTIIGTINPWDSSNLAYHDRWSFIFFWLEQRIGKNVFELKKQMEKETPDDAGDEHCKLTGFLGKVVEGFSRSIDLETFSACMTDFYSRNGVQVIAGEMEFLLALFASKEQCCGETEKIFKEYSVTVP